MQTPFAVLSFVVAPALLTNASCVLALSTINRMLRTREVMSHLYEKSEAAVVKGKDAVRLLEQVGRVENQAVCLLLALRSIYIALAAFAAATLVTLLGASLAQFQGELWLRILVALGIGLAILGVSGLVVGSLNLFRATQLSLASLREEASFIRERQSPDHGNCG
jgi:hypothetical protein